MPPEERDDSILAAKLMRAYKRPYDPAVRGYDSGQLRRARDAAYDRERNAPDIADLDVTDRHVPPHR